MMTCSCFENHKQLHKTIYTYIFHEMLALNVNMIRGNEHRWMDCRQNLGRSNWQIGALGDPWGPLGTLGDPWGLDLVPLGLAGALHSPGPGLCQRRSGTRTQILDEYPSDSQRFTFWKFHQNHKLVTKHT